MSYLTKYHNDMNGVRFHKFTKNELDIFFAICTEMRDKNVDEVAFTFKEVKELAKYSAKDNKRFLKELESSYNKLIELPFKIEHETGYTKFVLFTRYRVDYEKEIVEIKVNSEFSYILNELTSNFTIFELDEFTSLRSSYSKNMYKILKQFKSTGKYIVKIEQFRELLDIPEWYQMTHINSRVIAPIKKELPTIFKNFKIEKLKKGRSIDQLIFTFDPQNKKMNEENIFDIEPVIEANDQEREILQGQLTIKVEEKLYMKEPFIFSQTDYDLLISKYSPNLVDQKIQDTIKQVEKGATINNYYSYIEQSIVNHKKPNNNNNNNYKKTIGDTSSWYQSDQKEINQEDLKALNDRLAKREEKVLSEEQTEKIKKIFIELKSKPNYKKLNEQEIRTFIYFLEEQFDQKYNDNEKEKLKIEIKKIEEL